MHNSMFRRNIDGGKSEHVMQALFSNLMYSFTMLLQAMAPKRSVVSYESHGKLWEIPFHDGCFPKAPNISHTFSHGEIASAASKWWGKHLPYLDLM